jgi:hypothetical protein
MQRSQDARELPRYRRGGTGKERLDFWSLLYVSREGWIQEWAS